MFAEALAFYAALAYLSYVLGHTAPALQLETKMRKPGQVTVTMQAPDTAGGDTEVVKRKTAKHELLNAAGEVVEDEESADGIRYTLIALPDQPFSYTFGKDAQTDKFLAIFGAKTLATNESSAVRNNPKGEGSAQEQIDAVNERFALLATGKWVDRTREGVGAAVDKDVLAEAICQIKVESGQMTQEDVDARGKAACRQKLEDDKTFLAQARRVPEIAARYAQLKGKAAVTADALSF